MSKMQLLHWTTVVCDRLEYKIVRHTMRVSYCEPEVTFWRLVDLTWFVTATELN